MNAPILFSAPMIRALRREIAAAGTGKTQTRRVLGPGTTWFNGAGWAKRHKAQTWDWAGAWVDQGPSPAGNPGPYLKLPWLRGPDADAFEGTVHRVYPRHQPGLRLWVRENILQSLGGMTYPSGDYVSRWTREKVEYLSDEPTPQKRHLHPGRYNSPYMQFRPSIHMPRWASRLTLLVTEVRIQRLQEISEADAIAEGVEMDDGTGVYAGAPGRGVGGATRLYSAPILAFRDLWEAINGDGSWGANPWVIATTFIPLPCNIDQLPEDRRHAAA